MVPRSGAHRRAWLASLAWLAWLLTIGLAAAACKSSGPAAAPDSGHDALAADSAGDVAAGDRRVDVPDGDGDAVGPDPAAPENAGPYASGTVDGTFEVEAWGAFDTTVYFPAAEADASQPDRSGAPYPAVVFAHGHGGSKDVNTWVGRHLSSRGQVAILFSVPEPTSQQTQQWADGISAAIDHLAAATATSDGGPLQGLVDVERVAVAGHSQGANGALLAAAADDRIDAVVALCPCGDLLEHDAQVSAAVQLQVGSLDGVCPPADSWSHYNALSAPKQILVIDGGNHIGFLDPGLYYEAAKLLIEGGTLPDGVATITRDEQERIARRYLTAWISYQLQADATARPYLFGAEAQRDLSDGVLAALEHAE